MKHYVALLRGINLGKRRVKMEELRAMFERMGHSGVRTLQASGNVVFASKNGDHATLAAAIEAQIVQTFGFDSPTLVVSAAEIAALIKRDPFAKETLSAGSRTHITFLTQPLGKNRSLPYIAPDKSFRIFPAGSHQLACVVEPTTSSLSYMDYLGKQFGEEATTRTWKTVQKLHDLLSEAG
ncbi:MAG: DUF1697 domain-containing protein [Anaerolineales bacterium]|nr:DUF1697 domain-containing protein [Anaerolineales bacterium]MCW5887534.1 DUF1697 domain-containing protein [Anaerolineales bacterium]